jgi:uncharacterized protein (TIGR03067 family)
MRTLFLVFTAIFASCFAATLSAQTFAPIEAANKVAPRETDDSLTQKMQGSWTVAKAIFGGKPFPLDAKTVLKIKDTDYELQMPGAEDKGKLVIDTTMVPYQLTIAGTAGPNQGTKIPCIIKFEKEQMVICYQLDGGEVRPEKFESPEGSSLLLAYYDRVKEETGKTK